MLQFGRRCSVAALIACLAGHGWAQESQTALPLDAFADGINHWHNKHGSDYETHAPEDIAAIADNLLLYQRDNGGWVENRDPTRVLSDEEKEELRTAKDQQDTSFDNRNVYSQTEYLYGAYERTGDERYRDAARRGLDFILSEQIESCGGWPHSSPPRQEYHDRITITDEVTTGILTMLRRIADGDAPFAKIDAKTREEAEAAVARGNDCLLRLQVKQNGRGAAWAGQYDPETLEPTGARTFELPSMISWESVRVVNYLMGDPDPSPEMVTAIEDAVAWFDRVKLAGVKIEEFDAPREVYDYHTATTDRRLVEDTDAPPLWARFYDLETNEPVLANRDGVRVETYDQVHRERRTGYHWFGTWPEELLTTDYPKWKEARGK
ncbi:pectate lyase [Falsirhodobacter deserti]|uniref:pectate lyase n=1 Tax=Falsirhodobacter deserti TaxID=1365611 RepID=UPI0013E3E7B4|nr:pectate lyase [Falsirhodobacter deserti]